ncbi:MAG: hypothetical protein K1X88_17955 [Nannocystaceae bacterium]|nr:hypothetical protein [Nannocystaceae bacterium]
MRTLWLALLPPVLLLACDRGGGGCSRDSDCKGNRICSAGTCVDPPAAAPATAAPAKADAAPAAAAANAASPTPVVAASGSAVTPVPPVAAPTPTAAPSEPVAAGDGDAAKADAIKDADALRPDTVRGLCEKEVACGCPDRDTIDACIEGLDGLTKVPTSVVACIGAQTCAQICAGEGKDCIDSWYAEASAAEKARHDTVMGIIDNYPDGSGCPSGYRPSGGVCIKR